MYKHYYQTSHRPLCGDTVPSINMTKVREETTCPKCLDLFSSDHLCVLVGKKDETFLDLPKEKYFSPVDEVDKPIYMNGKECSAEERDMGNISSYPFPA